MDRMDQEITGAGHEGIKQRLRCLSSSAPIEAALGAVASRAANDTHLGTLWLVASGDDTIMSVLGIR